MTHRLTRGPSAMSANSASEHRVSMVGHRKVFHAMSLSPNSGHLYQVPPPQDEVRVAKKPRASKPKVKSGCITCKTRRVKCDEAKPHCLRCQKFGRVCDGYASEQPRPRSLMPLQPRLLSRSASLRSPSVSIHSTEEESRYFNYFMEHTACELAGFLDGSFWTRLVLQESHNLPAVRYAVIALGALSKGMESAPAPGLKVNIIQDMDKGHHEQAVRQHLRAIQALNQYISASSSPQLRNALIACMLFIVFETFQGSYAASVQQAYGGLNLLRSYYHGKLGSKPWIPRKSHSQSSKARDMEGQLTREFQPQLRCDNISDEKIIKMHIGEPLENGSPAGLAGKEYREALPMRTRSSHESLPSMAYNLEATGPLLPSRGKMQANINKEQRLDMIFPDKHSQLQHHEKSDILPGRSSHTSSTVPDTTLSAPATFIASTTSSSTNPTNPTNPTHLELSTTSRKRPISAHSPPPAAPILQNDLSIEAHLIGSFVRLDAQGLFFGMIPGIAPFIWDIHRVWQRPIPDSFPDFESAELNWDFLMDRVLRFWRRTAFNRNYAPSSVDPCEVIKKQYMSYLDQLSAFEKAFQPYLDAAMAQDGTIINSAALIVSLHFKCTLITVATVLKDSEMVYDPLLPEFRYIVRTCALMVSSPNNNGKPGKKNTRFSFEVGIVPALHLVISKCRDPGVRREAIGILLQNPRQEGGWDGVLIARIGIWLLGCEERGLPPPPLAAQASDYIGRCSILDESERFSYPSPPHMEDDVPHAAVRGFNDFDKDGLIGSFGTTPDTQVRWHMGPLDPGSQQNIVFPETRQPSEGIEMQWVIPEENRVQLMVVDFHIQERFIMLKCRQTLPNKNGKREEMDTLLAW